VRDGSLSQEERSSVVEVVGFVEVFDGLKHNERGIFSHRDRE